MYKIKRYLHDNGFNNTLSFDLNYVKAEVHVMLIYNVRICNYKKHIVMC